MRRVPRDRVIKESFDFYVEQLEGNRGNAQMLKGLAINLRAGIERIRQLAAQENCPEEFRDAPRRIGLLPVSPEEWWTLYRPVVQHDVVVSEELLREYEAALKGA